MNFMKGFEAGCHAIKIKWWTAPIVPQKVPFAPLDLFRRLGRPGNDLGLTFRTQYGAAFLLSDVTRKSPMHH